MSRSVPPISSDKPLGGRYKIISQLGVGGFGRTFLAQDLHLPGHPRCVVKQLKPQIRSDDTLQMARRCFHTEAQVLYQLGTHDQIPRLLAHFEDGQEFYLAQEFIEGDPLTKELIEGKSWPEARAVVMVKDILQVLTFVHQRQVIHRDLKPSNLIRRRQDHKIVLIDFGAVKQVGHQDVDPETGMTNLTISIGTQGYMPNEQLAGKPRFSSDIYAVGILGIQALTGIHPRHLEEEETTGEVKWHDHAPDASPELMAVLDRMVRYDFRARFPTAIEALAALDTVPVDLSDPALLLPLRPELSSNHGGDSSPTTAPFSNGFAAHSDLNFSAVDLTMASEEPLSPTAIWTPTEPLVQADAVTAEPISSTPPTAHTATNGTSPTQAIGRPHPVEPSQGSAISAAPSSSPLAARRWLAIGVGAIGCGILYWGLTQAGLLPSAFNRQPSPQPSSSPIVSPSPLTPKQRAIELFNAGKYEAARAAYDEAIQKDNNDAEAYAGRCETLNQLNRPEEALVSCSDALAYKPNYPEAIWSTGNALLLKGKTYEALERYDDVTYLKPDFAPGWIKQGVALQKLGRSAEALAALNQGIQLQRNSSEAWVTKGAALLNLKRYDDAVISLDKALQLDPNNTIAKRLRQQVQTKTQSKP